MTFRLLCLALVSSLYLSVSAQTTILVDTVADDQTFDAVDSLAECTDGDETDGDCTLREAIEVANANAGTDAIEFNIVSGNGLDSDNEAPIFLLNELPAITDDNVSIDGYSHPLASENTLSVGSDANIVIAIVGAGPDDGLSVEAAGVSIRGLSIINFDDDGIEITSGSATVTGCWIGIAPDLSTVGNFFGVFVASGTGTVIGGSTPADRNVISDNVVGVLLDGDAQDARVEGNYIGTLPDGISGAGNDGANFDALDLSANVSVIGNVFADSGGDGVKFGGSATGLVQGNLIGIGADGTTDLGNSDDGIDIEEDAVVTILENRIANNGQVGIDLSDPGGTETSDVTANDTDDTDTGPNGLQNYPVITGITENGPDFDVAFILDSVAGLDYRIEAFATVTPDPSGHGEGTRFLGSTTVSISLVTTQTAGSITVSGVSSGESISLTATSQNPTSSDFGGTSEFSAVAIAGGPLPVELTHFDAVATSTGVELTWATASETNNAGFFVERWALGVAGEQVADEQIARSGWAELGFVRGAGTVVEARQYGYEVNGLEPGLHRFRLRQVDFDGTVSYSPVVEAASGVPDQLALRPAYPNPFRTSTALQFTVPSAGDVTLTVYDALGRHVVDLYSGMAQAGQTYQATFDAQPFGAGTYFAILQHPTGQTVEQLTVLR